MTKDYEVEAIVEEVQTDIERRHQELVTALQDLTAALLLLVPEPGYETFLPDPEPSEPPGATIPSQEGVGTGEGEKVAEEGCEEARGRLEEGRREHWRLMSERLPPPYSLQGDEARRRLAQCHRERWEAMAQSLALHDPGPGLTYDTTTIDEPCTPPAPPPAAEPAAETSSGGERSTAGGVYVVRMPLPFASYESFTIRVPCHQCGGESVMNLHPGGEKLGGEG